MPRRGENIYKRKDGRYEGRYIKGRQLNGKICFGYIYGHSYTEVKTKLIKFKSIENPKKIIYSKTRDTYTLSEFLDYWLEKVIKDTVKYSTYIRYYERIHGYIIPVIGTMKISKITSDTVRAFTESLTDKKLAPSTVRGIVKLLSSVMKTAYEMEIISVNPCNNIKLPDNETKEVKALTASEQIAIENAAVNHSMMAELYIFISLYTGLRIGEICALKWSNIDFISGTLYVQSTVQRIKDLNENKSSKTMILEGKPKSRHSTRYVPLSAQIVEKLKEYKGKTEDNCYILSGSEKIIEPRRVRYDFKKILKKAKLDSISFHTLRHTYATRCMERNFDIKTLSELLGHSDASTTLKIYTHCVSEHKKLLSERIQILSHIS